MNERKRKELNFRKVMDKRNDRFITRHRPVIENETVEPLKKEYFTQQRSQQND